MISGPATAKSKASFRSGWKRSRRSGAISRPVSPLSAFRLAAHWPWLWRRAIAGSKPTSSDFCRRAWSELRYPRRLFCIPLSRARTAGSRLRGGLHGQKSWNGVAILARGGPPVLTRRGLPGDPDDSHSRYIEAAVNGVLIGCLYLPNGNPAPGPKFEYKLRWFDRLLSHADELLSHGVPIALIGDFNVMPTELDVYAPERWRDDALFRPEVRNAFAGLINQGWTDAVRHLHPRERIYTFWKYWRNSFERDAGLRLDHLLLSPTLAPRLKFRGGPTVAARLGAHERPCAGDG